MAKDATLGGRENWSLAAIGSNQKKKMTLGWVVNGERCHAGRQGELVPRGHWIKSEEEDDPRVGGRWRKTPRWAAGGIVIPRPRGHAEREA